MKKKIVALCLFMAAVATIHSKEAFAQQNDQLYIPWRFYVSTPDGEVVGGFDPQYVTVLHWGGYGWIMICTHFGELWTNVSSLTNRLYGRTIVLDPGHGIGADNTFMGYSEQAAMFALAMHLKPLLEAQGAQVFMTRKDYYEVHLTVRAALINLWSLEAKLEIYENNPWRCDFEIEELKRLIGIMQSIVYDFSSFAPTYLNFPFDSRRQTRIHHDLEHIFNLQSHPAIADNWLGISLHSNATGRPTNPEIRGADAYLMTNTNALSQYYFANYSHVENIELFADIILDNIEALGIPRREVRPNNFLIIRETNIPMILIENGFHTNYYDRALLSCDYFLQALAHAYLEAILSYFDEISSPY